MVETVYLHVGAPKSGTTYVQAVLAANKQRLRRSGGLLYPGASWTAQIKAARDILNANPFGAAPEVAGAWQQLVDEIHNFDGRAAVVSMEWLGSADTTQAAKMVDTLAPATVRVVITARDLNRTVPAAWQEFCQNWETWSWPEFLRSVTADDPLSTPAGRLFWTQQDLGRMLAIWGDLLPPSQLAVVTLPPSGAPQSELWSRFAAALEVEQPDAYDTTGGGTNESLGLESSELMRQVNSASRLARLPGPVYDDVLKQHLAKRVLTLRRPRERSLAVPAEYESWLMAKSQEQLAHVHASGAP
ncbi:MAG: hypothetical protein ACRDQA_28235, partial [Nocardioidaceae bacterium]